MGPSLEVARERVKEAIATLHGDHQSEIKLVVKGVQVPASSGGKKTEVELASLSNILKIFKDFLRNLFEDAETKGKAVTLPISKLSEIASLKAYLIRTLRPPENTLGRA